MSYLSPNGQDPEDRAIRVFMAKLVIGAVRARRGQALEKDRRAAHARSSSRATV
ncbi:hypothetical protein [Luethyella okanaganae]|uniref:Uncharacterized protein n=1 Tax=Luethyella okanaganae TaxID=69372 RepID=A0ABW1VD24_9MICO